MQLRRAQYENTVNGFVVPVRDHGFSVRLEATREKEESLYVNQRISRRRFSPRFSLALCQVGALTEGIKIECHGVSFCSSLAFFEFQWHYPLLKARRKKI